MNREEAFRAWASAFPGRHTVLGREAFRAGWASRGQAGTWLVGFEHADWLRGQVHVSVGSEAEAEGLVFAFGHWLEGRAENWTEPTISFAPVIAGVQELVEILLRGPRPTEREARQHERA